MMQRWGSTPTNSATTQAEGTDFIRLMRDGAGSLSPVAAALADPWVPLSPRCSRPRRSRKLGSDRPE